MSLDDTILKYYFSERPKLGTVTYVGLCLIDGTHDLAKQFLLFFFYYYFFFFCISVWGNDLSPFQCFSYNMFAHIQCIRQGCTHNIKLVWIDGSGLLPFPNLINFSKDVVHVVQGLIGGANRTFACKSQERPWQDWYILHLEIH